MVVPLENLENLESGRTWGTDGFPGFSGTAGGPAFELSTPSLLWGAPSFAHVAKGVYRTANTECLRSKNSNEPARTYTIGSIVSALAKNARACPERSRRDGHPQF
jgi:hypothetical protein